MSTIKNFNPISNNNTSDIKSYCAPDPFANFDPQELEKLVANMKMPNNKSSFRKIYREHVI